MSGVSSGQPSVESGHSPELNHVSSTSVSCSIAAEPQCEQVVGVSRATVIFLQLPQFHAGTRWPHQSCREMHQSRMLYIHSKYVLAQFAGTKVMRPSSTALIAGSARGFIFAHHCVETSGSTMVLQRWHF